MLEDAVARLNTSKNIIDVKPYSGLFFEAFIFCEFRETTANPRKLKSWKVINVEEARFSISIREITFREQELNWLFAKYKRLENNPL